MWFKVGLCCLSRIMFEGRIMLFRVGLCCLGWIMWFEVGLCVLR